jgi:hypothetical protein
MATMVMMAIRFVPLELASLMDQHSQLAML